VSNTADIRPRASHSAHSYTQKPSISEIAARIPQIQGSRVKEMDVQWSNGGCLCLQKMFLISLSYVCPCIYAGPVDNEYGFTACDHENRENENYGARTSIYNWSGMLHELIITTPALSSLQRLERAILSKAFGIYFDNTGGQNCAEFSSNSLNCGNGSV
jgi:hypothetical protein